MRPPIDEMVVLCNATSSALRDQMLHRGKARGKKLGVEWQTKMQVSGFRNEEELIDKLQNVFYEVKDEALHEAEILKTQGAKITDFSLGSASNFKKDGLFETTITFTLEYRMSSQKTRK